LSPARAIFISSGGNMQSIIVSHVWQLVSKSSGGNDGDLPTYLLFIGYGLNSLFIERVLISLLSSGNAVIIMLFSYIRKYPKISSATFQNR
jgi:hypothetical protein